MHSVLNLLYHRRAVEAFGESCVIRGRYLVLILLLTVFWQSSLLPVAAAAPEQKYKEFNRLMDANKLDDARKQALERIKRYPDDYLGFRDLARVSFEIGKFDEALGYFDQALKVNP